MPGQLFHNPGYYSDNFFNTNSNC